MGSGYMPGYGVTRRTGTGSASVGRTLRSARLSYNLEPHDLITLLLQIALL
jgi:hypothetical protein